MSQLDQNEPFHLGKFCPYWLDGQYQKSVLDPPHQNKTTIGKIQGINQGIDLSNQSTFSRCFFSNFICCFIKRLVQILYSLFEIPLQNCLQHGQTQLILLSLKPALWVAPSKSQACRLFLSSFIHHVVEGFDLVKMIVTADKDFFRSQTPKCSKALWIPSCWLLVVICLHFLTLLLPFPIATDIPTPANISKSLSESPKAMT